METLIGFFNELKERLASSDDATSDLRSYGIMPWSDQVDYKQYARVVGSNGNMYRARQESGPGTAAGARDPIINQWPREYWYVEQVIPPNLTFTGVMEAVQKQGVLAWATRGNYEQHARVVGSDGKLYKALVANGPGWSNAQNPVTETADPRAIWEEEAVAGPPGPRGPRGPQGPRGPRGPAGGTTAPAPVKNPPGRSTGVSVTNIRTTTATLNYDDPTTGGAAGWFEYIVISESGPTSGSTVDGSTFPHYPQDGSIGITNLLAGTTYVAQGRHGNSDGDGPWTEVRFTTPTS